MGPISNNGDYGISDTHHISETDHGEAGAVEVGWGVGYSKGGGSVGSGGNPVVNNLNCNKAGYGGTVGGAASDVLGILKGDGL